MSSLEVHHFTLTQADLNKWAELSGDENPLHVSPEVAQGSRFDGTIAHGHLVLALVESLLMRKFGTKWLEGGLLERVRFRAPVFPQARYRIELRPGDQTSGREEESIFDLAIVDANTRRVCVTGRAVLTSGLSDEWPA